MVREFSDIQDWIRYLKEEPHLIIVEGINDKRALAHVGITNVKSLGKQALYSFAESIKDRRVILLVDLDDEGKRLYKLLKTELNSQGIQVIDAYRQYLSDETPLRHIEGLTGYALGEHKKKFPRLHGF